MAKALLIFAPIFLWWPCGAQTAVQTTPELPRYYLDTAANQWNSSQTCTVKVKAGSNLQSAVDAAKDGDTLCLEVGAKFPRITLPAKTGLRRYITIRSAAADADLPAAGTRITPASKAKMATLMTHDVGPAITTAEGARMYRLGPGLEFTVDPAVTGLTYNVVQLGTGSETGLWQLPSDIVLDRVYVHGNPLQDTQRGVLIECRRCALVDSWVAEIHSHSFETQAIGAVNCSGPIKITNNHLSAAGENIMFGGAMSASPDFVPSDIEIRRNHLFNPLSWKKDDPSYAGQKWLIKNLLELKDARRVLVEGNVLENSWSDGQTGFAIVLSAVGNSYETWVRVEDITIQNNIIRNATRGINMAAYFRTVNNLTDPFDPTYDDPTQSRINRVLVKNNLFLKLGAQIWGPDGNNVVLDHNTFINDGADGWVAIPMDWAGSGPAYKTVPHRGWGLVGNVFFFSAYGIAGPGGANPFVPEFMTNGLIKGNVVLNTKRSGIPFPWPAGNTFSTDPGAVFVDYAGGNYKLKSPGPGADIDLILKRTAGVTK
jgi:hypothetical protein